MPYIPAADRDRVDQALKLLPMLMKVGEVNYAVTRVVDNFLEDHGINYANLNAMIGALECAKLELYRRMAAPYEDRKIEQHGDVYKARH